MVVVTQRFPKHAKRSLGQGASRDAIAAVRPCLKVQWLSYPLKHRQRRRHQSLQPFAHEDHTEPVDPECQTWQGTREGRKSNLHLSIVRVRACLDQRSLPKQVYLTPTTGATRAHVSASHLPLYNALRRRIRHRTFE